MLIVVVVVVAAAAAAVGVVAVVVVSRYRNLDGMNVDTRNRCDIRHHS